MRALVALLALSGCTSLPPVDLCKYADARRAVYTTVIRAADAYPPPVPREVTLGRDAAVVALTMLNRNCPEVTP